MSTRWFVEIMFEGQWERVGVTETHAAALEVAAEVEDWAEGRDIRVIQKRSTAKVPNLEEGGDQ